MAPQATAEQVPAARDTASDIRELVQRAEERVDLRARMDRLEQKLAGPPPWWQNPKTVTLIASLFAVIVPLTTAIEAYLKNKADLAMAAQQQAHAMRMDYVHTVLDSEVAERDRESRLRLLVALLTPSDPLYGWARNELARVTHQIATLEQSLAQDVDKLARLREEKLAAEAAAAAAMQAGGHDRAGTAAQEKLTDVKARASRLKAAASKAAGRLGGRGDDPLAGLDDI